MAQIVIAVFLLVAFWGQIPSLFGAGDIYYVATNGNDSMTCTQAKDIQTPKATFASVLPCVQPGDTLYIRGGTYNQQINLQSPSKTGTSTGWITISGYPGETVIFRYTDPTTYGPIKARGSRGYFVFQDFEIDGINMAHDSGWQIRESNHHFIVRRLKIYNQDHSGIYVGATSWDITLEDNEIHDLRSSCIPGDRHHAFYLHDGYNVIARRNKVWNTPGGGFQVYPGPWTNIKVQDNLVHHTNTCSSSNTGGIVVGSDNNGQVGDIIDAEVTGNIIAYTNRKTDGTGNGTAMGLRVYNNDTLDHQVSGTKVHNNTIYKVYNYTVDPLVGTEYCMNIATGALNTDVRNNYMSDCAGGANGGTLAYNNSGIGTTASHNACTASENCPPTNKVSVASPTDVFVDPANLDFRLKQGTNALRNSGTAVATGPTAVGVRDIGAFEQGEVASAAVVGGYIEATMNVSSSGVQPTTNITAFQVNCISCTGTPVVDSANILPGGQNVARLSISGITSPGSCSLTYGNGNMRDSRTVGPLLLNNSQFVNSVSGLTVTGTCQNTAGGPSPGGLYLHYKLNTGSGTQATDETGNGRHGTIVGSPSWITPVVDSYGLYFANDGVDRSIDIPYGNGVDPSATSFTLCGHHKLDVGVSSKIVGGAGALGTNQRFYYGTSQGQTWQLGVQGQSYSTIGQSEFPVTNNLTRVCIAADAVNNFVYLVVNGVKGNTTASKQPITSYTMAANLVINCGVSTLGQCGGLTVDEIKLWDKFLSDAEFLEDYEEFNAPATPLACHSQVGHKGQHVKLRGGTALDYLAPNSTLSVVEGGGVVVIAQVDCTVVPGSPLGFKWFYSLDGTNFNNEVPLTLGAGGVAMWNQEQPRLNVGPTVCCLSGALTPNSGPILNTTNLSPTVTLTTGSSYTLGGVFRFAPGLAGTSIWLKLKQDNAVDLANGYPNGVIRIDLVKQKGSFRF